MKNIIIEVPRNGTTVHLTLGEGASSGQVVIVASDDVEIRLTKPTPVEKPKPKTTPAPVSKVAAPKIQAGDLDAILSRLIKLKPTKRAAAVNSIKAMFQFDAPINDQAAGKILEDLRKRGSLTIDASNKLQFRNEPPSK